MLLFGGSVHLKFEVIWNSCKYSIFSLWGKGVEHSTFSFSECPDSQVRGSARWMGFIPPLVALLLGKQECKILGQREERVH